MAAAIGLLLTASGPPPDAAALSGPAPHERPLTREESAKAMDALTGPPAGARGALRRILVAGDSRFIAVLLEVLRASETGILNGVDDAALVRALTALSHKPFGADWPAWAEWYAGTRLGPPAGFTGWKGRLLARVDPRFATFLTDAAPSRIRSEEIQWGGVRVDGIPALMHPAIVSAAAAGYLIPSEPVFGLESDGQARAYPLRILDWHELVNDRLGGRAISLTYCSLCGAGIAYEGRASDGRTYTFGSSGLLYGNNKLMYDHQTGTLWHQLTGEPALGPLARTNARLGMWPVVLTTWRAWRAEHPRTTALDVQTGYDRPYVPGVPYGAYYASAGTMFPVQRRSRALPLKARVFGLRVRGIPKAFPIDALAARRVVDDTIAGERVALIAKDTEIIVAGRPERGAVDRLGPPSAPYSAGLEVRAFRRGEEEFRPGTGPDSVVDRSGRVWRVTEEALIGPGGRRAGRIAGSLTYWFAWYEFFPQTLVWRP